MSYSIPRGPIGKPTVTVVIPCYRYGHYLAAAVHAALDQQHVQVKVVIVDDKSPDDSASIARVLAASDSRIEVIVHEQNMGHIRTYNDGLAAVDTEFVTLVSADDLIAPGALDRAVSLMQRNSSVGLVYGKVVRFETEPPAETHRLGAGVWRIMQGRAWIREIAERGFNPIMSPEAVLRTEALRQVGVYNADLPHSGDLEYWLRIAARWDVGQIRGQVQAYYRVHGANMHLTTFGSSLDDIRQKISAFGTLDAGGAASDEGTSVLFDIALRTLIDEALSSAAVELDAGNSADATALATLAEENARDDGQRGAARSLLSQIAGGIDER